MDPLRFLTRKDASCSDLLSCLYDMKSIEIEVFYSLVDRKEATLDQVAAAVHRDRSTVHRCLSKLVIAGLVYKQSRTRREGGYFHVYSPVEPARIREQARLRVEEISQSLRRLVDDFESDFRIHLGGASRSGR